VNYFPTPKLLTESSSPEQLKVFSTNVSRLRNREQKRRAGKPRQPAATFLVPLSGPVTVPRGLHQLLRDSGRIVNFAATLTRTEPAPKNIVTDFSANHDPDEKKGKALQVLQRLVRIALRVLRAFGAALRF